ncbi:cytochrome ubiquinol oxidase subunit I, partial [Pseudoroseomonas aestuarii]
ALRRGRVGACALLSLLGGGAVLLAAADVAALALWHGAPPASHAYAATALVLALYVALHAALGTIMALYTAARCQAGYVSAMRDLAPRNTLMWQGYTALCGLAALLLLQLWPWMAGAGTTP